MIRRISLLVVGLAIALVPLAQAGADEPPPPPSTTGAEPPPAVDPPPPVDPGSGSGGPGLVIPDGITIDGIPVGGMTVEQATLAVEDVFDTPLQLRHGRRSWSVRPDLLGARPRIQAAMTRALAAPPGSAVDLLVVVNGRVLREYVSALDESFSRPARSSTVRLVKLKPRISEARAGFRVAKSATTAALARALARGERGPLSLPGAVLRPRVTASNFGPIVVIRRETKKLILYRGERVLRRFGVATGQAAFPTPVGRFQVLVKWRNPWWYPPPSPWAEGEKPVPPGPGNPLGTRWMGLSAPLVGIHGTPDAASIGYSASHGCIRMRIPEAEWLFERVRIGTPVFIVRA